MVRSKIGAVEQGRRARLHTSSEDDDSLDPIAAAAEAKRVREGQISLAAMVRTCTDAMCTENACCDLQSLGSKQLQRRQ